ncbi:acetyltransferase-like isoleucine patch superfamily enzyme [Desulfobaculum xiamenense]|uniref:Acetyltransferase-like isoleucine patch superfamily enzyme n=1 Tax=Desulfobaculum xiamenense TaxID=995050 RepID=A0A846QKF3_9BACT|nr:acyltransferase [Desulfobaculum xiamenense]NJB68678.1 acetyltransferase-like isoleucine patch superfamily enzyme [Desulfobaculum xiamenense]
MTNAHSDISHPGDGGSLAARLRHFLGRGYTLRETVLKGLRLYVWARIHRMLRYSFRSCGRGVIVDPSCIVDGGRFIELADNVWVQRGTWLCVPLVEMERPEDRAYLSVGSFTRIGPNCTLAAASRVVIEDNVLLGPNVTVLDHAHAYEDVTRPVARQGIKTGGRVVVRRNAWLAANVVVHASSGTLEIGENSVVAANSVVIDSVPPRTVVAGNPARPILRHDAGSGRWVRVRSADAGEVTA